MSIAAALQRIHDRIDRAAGEVGRASSEVTLIGVTKTVGVEAIQEAYDLGLRDFGESRLQEALPKMEALPDDICWHFIGALQSNKAKRIGERFALVHSVSTDSALVELAKVTGPPEVLIEVNIADEQQKSGISPKSLDEYATRVLHCDQVHLRGLMTVGPALEPEAMQPYFREMRRLKEQLGLPILSMGMSSDFDVAVKEGATHIRVGNALFGARR